MNDSQSRESKISSEFRIALLAFEPKPDAVLVSERLFQELQAQGTLKDAGVRLPSPSGSAPVWRVHLEFEGTVVACDPVNLGHHGQAHWSVFHAAA